MQWWILGALATALIGGAYVAIGVTFLRDIQPAGRYRHDRLGVATSAIFLSAAGGHLIHLFHMLLPAAGVAVATGLAARAAFAEWPVWVWHGFTASIALWYWRLRARHPALADGAAGVEDLRERQRDALDIHDDVIQGLVKAKLALDLERHDQTREELERTLDTARRIMSGLVGELRDGGAPIPGDLHRSKTTTQP